MEKDEVFWVFCYWQHELNIVSSGEMEKKRKKIFMFAFEAGEGDVKKTLLRWGKEAEIRVVSSRAKKIFSKKNFPS